MRFIKFLKRTYLFLFRKVTLFSLLILGISIFVGSFYNWFSDDETINVILQKVGEIFLIGGVVTAIIQSFQFIGVFQSALSDIIYTSHYLDKQSDKTVRETWDTVSKSLYKKKFREISDLLHNAVCDFYFPIKIEWYHKDYVQYVDITWIDKKSGFVKVVDDIEMKIRARSESQKIPLKFIVEYEKGKDDDKSSFTLDKLVINENDYTETCEIVESQIEGDNIKMKYELNLELKGNKQYDVHRQSTKILNIFVDPTKSYKSLRILHGLELHVKHPKDLVIKFYPEGIIGEFKILGDEKINDKIQIGRKFDGLIFPRQGFRLVYLIKQ